MHDLFYGGYALGFSFSYACFFLSVIRGCSLHWFHLFLVSITVTAVKIRTICVRLLVFCWKVLTLFSLFLVLFDFVALFCSSFVRLCLLLLHFLFLGVDFIPAVFLLPFTHLSPSLTLLFLTLLTYSASLLCSPYSALPTLLLLLPSSTSYSTSFTSYSTLLLLLPSSTSYFTSFLYTSFLLCSPYSSLPSFVCAFYCYISYS